MISQKTLPEFFCCECIIMPHYWSIICQSLVLGPARATEICLTRYEQSAIKNQYHGKNKHTSVQFVTKQFICDYNTTKAYY